MQPGDFVEMSTVIRNWWSFPAVGFNAILEGMDVRLPSGYLTNSLPWKDPPILIGKHL
jgi:hypothetical protein